MAGRQTISGGAAQQRNVIFSHEPVNPMSNLPQHPGGGLAPNVAGALAYLLGPITGIFFFLVEKRDGFVRFHAAQSIVVGIAMVAASIALTVVGMVLAVIPLIGWIVGFLLSVGFALGSFALWIVLMFRAFQGHEWNVPVVAAYARRLSAAPAIE